MIDTEFILKMLRFGIVGLSGMGVDFGITYLLKEKLKVHKYIANSTGFTVAAISNYLFNRIWTFQSSSPEVVSQLLRFLVFALLGLALNNLVIFLLTDSRIRLNFYLAKAAAIFIVFFWNFFMNYFFTFS